MTRYHRESRLAMRVYGVEYYCQWSVYSSEDVTSNNSKGKRTGFWKV